MGIYNTFVINPIRQDFIRRCLETLYTFTPGKFRIILVDQTFNGLPKDIQKMSHLYLRPHRNLGFAKSMNEGIVHGMRWGSKYITCMNDDIEFIHRDWWLGIEETFDMDEKIMATNPMSPREPGWGYGLDHGKYIDLLPYKKEFSDKDYQFLLEGDFSKVREKIMDSGKLPEQVQKNWEAGHGLPAKKVGVIDAIATWCTTFRRESIEKFGYFDERYYPGGGEDYDYNARVYREGYRMVGTTKSWVWHWWGSSKDKQTESMDKGKSYPIEDKYRWMNPDELWPPDKNGGQQVDPWGHWTDDKGKKNPMYRVPEVSVVDI